jgi:hypothetical protein
MGPQQNQTLEAIPTGERRPPSCPIERRDNHGVEADARVANARTGIRWNAPRSSKTATG